MNISNIINILGRFLFAEIILCLALFLLCLLLGQLTAAVRLSRVPVLMQLLNTVFALFRRVPLLALLALAAIWERGMNYGGQLLRMESMFIVLLLRFVPDMSDVQMEGMRKAPESRNPEGAGAWKLFKQSLAFSVSDRAEVLCGIWKSLFLCGWLFRFPYYPMVESMPGVPFLLVTVSAGYWIAGLLVEAGIKFLLGRLQEKA